MGKRYLLSIFFQNSQYFFPNPSKAGWHGTDMRFVYFNFFFKIISDNSKGASKIFIGANRHYPDGFSILIDEDLVMHYDPLKNVGLEVYKCPKDVDPSNFYLGREKSKIDSVEMAKR